MLRTQEGERLLSIPQYSFFFSSFLFLLFLSLSFVFLVNVWGFFVCVFHRVRNKVK